VLGSMYNRVGNCNIFFIARVNTTRRSANVIGTPRPNLKFKVSRSGRYRRTAMRNDVTRRAAPRDFPRASKARDYPSLAPIFSDVKRETPFIVPSSSPARSPSPPRSTSRFTFSVILPAGPPDAITRARARARAPCESNCTRYADRTEFRFSSTGSILRNRT